MSVKITRHQNLDVYKRSFQAAMQIFEVSKQFPKEETYSLTDQIRVLRDQSALTWRRRGVNDVMRQLLLTS